LLEDAGAIGGEVHSSFGVDDRSTVQRVLAWIDSLNRDERFFVAYLPVAGHHPYQAPEPGPFLSAGGNADLTSYLNALHYGDRVLGELLEGLRARHLDKNTLFLFFGDHGEAFGQHEGNFGHTLFIYEENVHVPYVIAAPGLIETEIRASAPASLIDTAPTVLDLLGLPIPLEFQGSSMLDPQPRMSLFFTDYSLGWLGLVDACRKYLFEINSGRSKLYDMCNDPEEVHDLSDRESHRVPAYRSRLQAWITAGTAKGKEPQEAQEAQE
jgi:lipoteichoic acid synthase